MKQPPISKLLEKVDNRYTLSIMAAKRARQLASGERYLCDEDVNKDVLKASFEIAEDKLKYVRTKSGLK